MSTFADIISTTGAVGVVAAVFGTLLVLMERTHRRSQDLSRNPFGADLRGDSDVRRTREELRAVRGRQRRPAPWRRGSTPTGTSDVPARRGGSHTSRIGRRTPHTLRHV